MSQIQLFLQELEKEAQTTRKMLAIIPDDQYDWQPHPKSMTVRRLATHIAELPGWVTMALDTDELDFANNPYKTEEINNTAALLAYFERSFASGKASLEKATDDDLIPNWTLRNGEEVYSVATKAEVIRMSLSQTIHHRAQMGVFLRLLDVPIPGSYGPSADEMNF